MSQPAGNDPVAVAGSFEWDFQNLMEEALAAGPDGDAGGWSVKQMVGHIAAWDREMLEALGHVLHGRPAHYASWNEDNYNREVARRVEGLSWKSVQAEAVAANAALTRAIRNVGIQDWSASIAGCWPDGSPMTPASVTAYTYKGRSHYAGHAMALRAGE